MSETAVDRLPPLKPGERHTRLAVDTFCVECGYNLHSQEVVRDERLGIFICRCPECGRFHPAGVGITATKPWLARFATMILVLWVLMVLFAVFWIVMGFGAIQVTHVEDFSYRSIETPDGRPVEWAQVQGTGWQPVLKGTTQPALQWRQLRSLTRQNPNDRRRDPWEAIALVICSAALGFVTGLLLVCFLWHWKRRRYIWVMFLPFAVAGAVATVMVLDDDYERIISWAMQVVFGYAGLQMTFIGAGILLGRPIARGLLRMFIPPKARQHFSFLWGVDGKRMTPAIV